MANTLSSDQLGELFLQVLKLCETAGLVKLGHVALDGTKIKANASKHKAMSYERINRGSAFQAKGDRDQAIADYNKVIEINPQDAEAYYNRALATLDKGDRNRTLADYTKAIEIRPGFADAYVARSCWRKRRCRRSCKT